MGAQIGVERPPRQFPNQCQSPRSAARLVRTQLQCPAETLSRFGFASNAGLRGEIFGRGLGPQPAHTKKERVTAPFPLLCFCELSSNLPSGICRSGDRGHNGRPDSSHFLRRRFCSHIRCSHIRIRHSLHMRHKGTEPQLTGRPTRSYCGYGDDNYIGHANACFRDRPLASHLLLAPLPRLSCS